MHEMALTEGVVKVLQDQARQHGFARVKTVWLEIGKLSHVDPESMLFCFQAVAKDTVAEGAEVRVLRPDGTAWCMSCSKPVIIEQRYDPCPLCGGHQITVTGGEEMRIKEMEVE